MRSRPLFVSGLSLFAALPVLAVAFAPRLKPRGRTAAASSGGSGFLLVAAAKPAPAKVLEEGEQARHVQAGLSLAAVPTGTGALLVLGDEAAAAPKSSGAEKEPKEWHQDIRFLARALTWALPFLVLVVLAFEALHRTWADVDFDTPLPTVNAEDSSVELSMMGRGFGALTGPYFLSRPGRKGRIYCAVVLLLGLCALFLAVVHNAWQKEWWDAIEKKRASEFTWLLQVFCVLIVTFVLNDVYSQYIRQMLYIHWRDFMTRSYISRWLGTAYTMQLDRDRRRRVENPDQRIQEDVHLFCDSTIIIVYEFLNSLGHLVVFLPLTLMLSPSRAFGVYYCPGWLIYLAIIYSLFGTLATHFIGQRLITIGFARQQSEADFRFGLVNVRHHADSIVMYRGAQSEELNLVSRFERIKALWWLHMLFTKRLSFFIRSFSFVQMMVPLIVLAPSYFKGDISMGTLFQLTQALGTVCTAFDWFVNAYGTLTHWRATADRLLALNKAIDAAQLCQSKAVRHDGKPPPDGPGSGAAEDKIFGLVVRDLNVNLPDGSPLWSNLSLSVERGEWVLITGREGIGKSVLFRALAGVWPYVESGELWLAPTQGAAQDIEGERKAKADRALFVPQKSYFPAFCTLRGALSYPEPPPTYSDAVLLEALQAVKLESVLEGNFAPLAEEDTTLEVKKCADAGPPLKGRGLEMEANWALVLSPGMQQRLAFARVILSRPELLFLDEATSSVGEDSAREMYALLKERLPAGATVVSISHEVQLLAPLHDRTLVVEGSSGIGAPAGDGASPVASNTLREAEGCGEKRVQSSPGAVEKRL